MIKLNKKEPYGIVTGITEDGCKYRQNGYRFTADSKIIGDSEALEAEARTKEFNEHKAKMDKLQSEMDAAARKAPTEPAPVEVASTEPAPVEVASTEPAPVEVTITEEVVSTEGGAQEVSPAVHIFEGRAYTKLELEETHHSTLRRMVKEKGGEYDDKIKAIDLLLAS